MAYATTPGGHRIYVNPADPRAYGLMFNKGSLIPGSLRLWRRAVGLYAWGTVVDIGVNYGEMLVGAEFPEGAHLIGFEPNTGLYPYLTKTLAERGVEVDLRQQAIADKPGTARFAVDLTWSGYSSLYDERHDESARWRFSDVTVTTLDEVLGDGADDSFCVKVDVEGFEREVVEGAARVLRERTHWALMLEIEHMDHDYLHELAVAYDVFLMAKKGDGLLPLPADRAAMAAMLDEGGLHKQDCLVLSPAVAAALG